jgi:hypothetical protein
MNQKIEEGFEGLSGFCALGDGAEIYRFSSRF